jgi:hypothetical protein
MHTLFAALVPVVLALPQEPKTPPPESGRIQTVRFDHDGWPIVPDEPRAVTAPVTAPQASPPPAGAPVGGSSGRVPPAPVGETAPALASGMQLGSPLVPVFQAVRSPAAFRNLGGVAAWWRLSVHGDQGEVIGVREVTHLADCAFAARDRVQHTDGRVFGRDGAVVFAERQGMPWPTLAESAAQELALLGLHLRAPWCFGDASDFVVVGRDAVDRGGRALSRVVVERRPPPGTDVMGPQLDPAPRDRFELLCEPSTGEPRELVHRFANGGQARRCVLEDWREVQGVRMPFRRTYVDEHDRRTTTIDLLRIESTTVAERDFRLR